MDYRFIGDDGREVTFAGAEELHDALERGAVHPESLIFEATSGAWIPLREHPVYQDSPPASASDAEPDANRVSMEENPGSLMRAGQLGAVVAAMFVLTRVAGYPAFSVGFFGVLLGVSITAGLLTVWTPRSRQFFPFALLLGTLVLAYNESRAPTYPFPDDNPFLADWDDSLSRAQDERPGREDYESPLSRILPLRPADPAPMEDRDAAPSPDGSVEDRLLWAFLQLIEMGPRISEEVQRRHDVDGAPGVWLEPDYLANPSRYPEVPEFFARMRGFIDDYVNTSEEEIRRRFDAILEQADLPTEDRAAAERGFEAAFTGFGDRAQLTGEVMLDLTETGEELHRALVEGEHLTRLNPVTEQVEVQDPELEERVREMLLEIERLFDALSTIEELQMERGRQLLQSVVPDAS